jgi:hypothetical protein
MKMQNVVDHCCNNCKNVPDFPKEISIDSVDRSMEAAVAIFSIGYSGARSASNPAFIFASTLLFFLSFC